MVDKSRISETYSSAVLSAENELIRRWFAMIDYKLTVEVLEARIAPIGWSID